MQYKTAAQIPSESFVTGNARIMATVKTGQLTTDHQMGVAGLFGPTKHDRSLIQSSRVMLLVNDHWHAPVDEEERSVIRQRGYEPGTNIIRTTWEAGGIEVEDRYYIPLDVDVLIQQTRVRNTTNQPQHVKLVAVLCPHLGATVEYKKGSCRVAEYEKESASIRIEDHRGNVLLYAFDRTPTEHQIGQICGKSDVFFDLEDHRLSGGSELENAVVNAAMLLDLGTLAPGQQTQIELALGRFESQIKATTALCAFRDSRQTWIEPVREYWSDWLSRGVENLNVPELSSRLVEIENTSRVILATHQTTAGVIVVGSTASDYQGAIAARNGCYCLAAMDRLGYHDRAAQGLEFFLNFKVGDDRFCSPDENDQLGTIIHCFKKHDDLTGDDAFLARHYPSLNRFAHAIIDLVDPAQGLIYSERAIHEFVAVERGYETYVNVMAFRGLDDAAQLALRCEKHDDAKLFAHHAQALRHAILTRLYSAEHRSFAKRIYQGQLIMMPAISMLTPALFDVLPASDPRVTSTIEYVMKHLWDKQIGGLYRYPLALQPWDEIPYGGPWVTYTCWLSRVHLKRGEFDAALRCLQWVIDQVPADSNLMPEHLSVAHQRQRGFHRVYREPVLAECWATAEFLVAAHEYQAAQRTTTSQPGSVPMAVGNY